MSYRIVNKNGAYLSAFHPNGGWQIGDVFPCSKRSWLTFESKNKVRSYFLYLVYTSEEQRKRWGDWTDKALKFIKTLRYEDYY